MSKTKWTKRLTALIMSAVMLCPMPAAYAANDEGTAQEKLRQASGDGEEYDYSSDENDYSGENDYSDEDYYSDEDDYSDEDSYNTEDGFVIEDGVLTKYVGEDSRITIPDGVTSIGEKAFFNCNWLTEITIPSSVTSIGKWAFWGCDGLTEVTIPSSVTIIRQMTFFDCDGLTKITIPPSVTSIGDWAFWDCDRLTEVTIPSGVTSIGKGAFHDCDGLTEITIPSSVTSIGAEAFDRCSSLTKVTILSSVTSIGTKAFYRCDSLTLCGKEDSYAEAYAAEWNIPFEILLDPANPRAISKCEITLGKTTYTYNGKAWTPAVTVTDGNKTLTSGTDYTVAYENNVNAGTAQVVVSGMDCYTGSVTKTFTIKKAAQKISYTKSYNKVYGNKAFTVNAKRTAGDGALTYASSNKKVAVMNSKGKVTIKGTGAATITVKAAATANYNAKSVKITVKVSPKKQKIKSLKTPKGRKLTASWTKDTRATGYQIQYSTDKNFKTGVRTATVTKNKTTSKTFTELTAGKKYYVRVRSYKTAKVNGKSTKLYGAWSAAKRSGSVKKGTPQMETVNVSWDLKNNKTLTIKTKYAGIGMKSQKVKMSGYKIKNSKKAGYKELTFTVRFMYPRNVSSSDVQKIEHNLKDGEAGGRWYLVVTDYNSGKSLEGKNNLDVTVDAGEGYDYFNEKTYYDDDGCWIKFADGTVTVKVTYPKDYKGLCIGVGGYTTVNETQNNEKFWPGTVSFAKTSYYSKNDKSVAHFMRVK